MIRNVLSTLALASLVFGASGASAEGGVKVGYLKCNVAAGWGYVFGSTKELSCAYHPSGGGKVDLYSGRISSFGVDVGFQEAAIIMWGVFAPGQVSPGSLAGDYGGVTAQATWGVGLGANVLFGGGKDSIALQPVSVAGQEGLNAAAGIAGMTIKRKK